MIEILQKIVAAGGHPLVVGGAVRDQMMGLEPKDTDVEVYGLDAEALTQVLAPFGKVDLVGRSFGVIKLRAGDTDYDFSLPRRESKVGRGHKGFVVTPDPWMTPREAAARRDFTWNGLARDPMTGEILDFFGGLRDIEDRVIRHTSPAFVEDPLRVLRGMQFAARFDMTVAPETAELCRSLRGEYDSLAQERVWGEWLKWAVKGQKPSRGLEFLARTGWLTLYPELYELIWVLQDPEFHPEGYVFQHTCHTVDAAARIANRQGLDEKARLILVFAALCHDLGKFNTTVLNEEGRWTSPGHAQTGVDLAQAFLARIGAPTWLVDKVLPLVREHLAHLNPITDRAVRRLANRLAPATVEELAWLIEADHSGRPPLPGGLPEAAAHMLALAQEQRAADGRPQSILMGRHLLAAGLMESGPAMGKLLRAAREAQLDGVFTDVPGALEWARAQL